eukprot:1155772-Pelagomonas_calceolata.AAC.2
MQDLKLIFLRKHIQRHTHGYTQPQLENGILDGRSPLWSHSPVGGTLTHLNLPLKTAGLLKVDLKQGKQGKRKKGKYKKAYPTLVAPTSWQTLTYLGRQLGVLRRQQHIKHKTATAVGGVRAWQAQHSAG